MDVAGAAKAARGGDEAAREVVGAAARERGGTGREATDVARVEAEAVLPGAADAVAAISRRAAASTARTSAMIYISQASSSIK